MAVLKIIAVIVGGWLLLIILWAILTGLSMITCTLLKVKYQTSKKYFDVLVSIGKVLLLDFR